MNNNETTLKNSYMAKLVLKNFVKNYGAVIFFMFIALLALFFVPNFASFNNFIVIIKQSAIPIIASVGMTLVLMTGGIDLSLGYSIGFISSIVGLLIKTLGVPIWLSVLAGLLVGALIGTINGVLVDVIKVPAFIATLGTGYIILGSAQIVSKGNTINRLPEGFLAIGQTPVGPVDLSVIYSIVIAIIFYIILQRSIYGRQLEAFGYNKKTSFSSGIDTRRMHISAYTICGILTAMASILLTIRVNCAQPDMGGGDYTFEIITAVVVGGGSLFGGKGTIIGSVFGVLIIKVIENCINLLNIQYFLFKTVMGIIILFSLIFESVKNKKL